MTDKYQFIGAATQPRVDPVAAVVGFAIITFTLVACLIGIWGGSWQWAATGLLPGVVYRLYARRN